MTRSLLLTPLFVLLPIIAVAACGGGDSTDPAPQPGATSTAPGATVDPAMPTTAPTTPATAPTTPAPTEVPWVAPVVATTSSGCGTAQADAAGVDYATPAGRTYHVWGPTGYDPTKTYPVVFAFHGVQASGPTYEQWFQMELYTQNEAFVVYPDAAGPNAYWDVDGDTDLIFFDDMVKQLGQNYCINPSRVLGYGFSYGGHFADHLGCSRAGYVKAIAVGDGGPGGSGQHCGRLPVLVTTRVLDTNEFEAYGKNVAARWTTLDGCSADVDTTPQSDNGTDMGYCSTQKSCKNPGGLTFCEDPSAFPAGSPPDWNHTVREYYRAYTYSWFKALP
jgi:poly(3-hydroxybutyrate) depolymerase